MPTILYEGVRKLSSTAEMNISEMKTHMCDDGGIRSHTDFVFLLFDRTEYLATHVLLNRCCQYDQNLHDMGDFILCYCYI